MREYYPDHKYIFTMTKQNVQLFSIKQLLGNAFQDTSIFSGETCTIDLAPFHRATLKESLSSQTHSSFNYS